MRLAGAEEFKVLGVQLAPQRSFVGKIGVKLAVLLGVSGGLDFLQQIADLRLVERVDVDPGEHFA